MSFASLENLCRVIPINFIFSIMFYLLFNKLSLLREPISTKCFWFGWWPDHWSTSSHHLKQLKQQLLFFTHKAKVIHDPCPVVVNAVTLVSRQQNSAIRPGEAEVTLYHGNIRWTGKAKRWMRDIKCLPFRINHAILCCGRIGDALVSPYEYSTIVSLMLVYGAEP